QMGEQGTFFPDRKQPMRTFFKEYFAGLDDQYLDKWNSSLGPAFVAESLNSVAEGAFFPANRRTDSASMRAELRNEILNMAQAESASRKSTGNSTDRAMLTDVNLPENNPRNPYFVDELKAQLQQGGMEKAAAARRANVYQASKDHEALFVHALSPNFTPTNANSPMKVGTSWKTKFLNLLAVQPTIAASS